MGSAPAVLSNPELAGGLLVALLVLAGWSALALRRLWRRPRIFAAVHAALALSLLLVVPWSFIASVAIGPAWIDLNERNPRAAIMQLLGGPFGHPGELVAVVSGLGAACGALAALRKTRLERRATAPGRPRIGFARDTPD
jgi:hypothetical protein